MEIERENDMIVSRKIGNTGIEGSIEVKVG